MKSLSYVRLCNPMDCSLPGSSVHGIFQARVLEWVAMSFSRRSSWPRNRTQVSHIVGRRFTSEPPGKSLGTPNLFIFILEMGIIIWIKTDDYHWGITDSMDMGWVDSGSWWWIGRPGVLKFIRSQRVGHDWVTELNWTCLILFFFFHSLWLEF